MSVDPRPAPAPTPEPVIKLHGAKGAAPDGAVLVALQAALDKVVADAGVLCEGFRAAARDLFFPVSVWEAAWGLGDMPAAFASAVPASIRTTVKDNGGGSGSDKVTLSGLTKNNLREHVVRLVRAGRLRYVDPADPAGARREGPLPGMEDPTPDVGRASKRAKGADGTGVAEREATALAIMASSLAAGDGGAPEPHRVAAEAAPTGDAPAPAGAGGPFPGPITTTGPGSTPAVPAPSIASGETVSLWWGGMRLEFLRNTGGG